MIAILLGLLAQHIVPVLIGAGGIILAIWSNRAGVKSERNRTRAKEADAYEKHLKEIADAADARNSVRVDRVPEHDPYRRD